MSLPTSPHHDAVRQPRHPRWRIKMWIACAVLLSGTLILLGMEIGHARVASGVFDWALVVFALTILMPAGEWAIRHYVGTLRAELAAHDDRVEYLSGEIAALREAVTTLHEVVVQMRAEYGERLDTELLRGTQTALDELTGGAVVALPQRVPAARTPANGRR